MFLFILLKRRNFFSNFTKINIRLLYLVLKIFQEICYLQDTEEDQTGLEDFQECIEEFQECLDVVHICIEAENSSFSHSPSMSHLDELVPSPKTTRNNNSPSLTETNYLLLNARNLADSDIDVSFKSISEAENVDKVTKIIKKDMFAKSDSLTQSDRPSDGYETCLDESLSEDNRKSIRSNLVQKLPETESCFDANIVQNCNTKSVGSLAAAYDIDDLTPTNSRINIVTDQFFHEVPDSSGQSFKPTGKVVSIDLSIHSFSFPQINIIFVSHFESMRIAFGLMPYLTIRDFLVL